MNTTAPSRPTLVIVFSACIGGLLEAYDFTIYAYLVIVLNKLFFSPASNQLGLVLTFAIFAAGYLIRPLGGILFGHIGDRFGRKKGLVYTICIMGSATLLIGFLPTYQQVGIAAPLLLLFCRLIQGIAMGGDLPGGLTYISEAAGDRGGRYTGFFLGGISGGCLLGIIIIYGLHSWLGDSLFMAWGWRAVFWFSLVLSVLGLYQRRKLEESPSFEQLVKLKRVQRAPIASVFKQYWPTLIKAFLLLSSYILMVCEFTVYAPTYLSRFFGLKYNDALGLTGLGTFFYLITFISSGFIYDWLGERAMRYIALAVIILAPTTYGLLLLAHCYAIGLIFIFMCTAFTGVCLMRPVSLIFTHEVRYTGIGLVFNLLFAIGGTIPAVLTAAIPLSNSPVTLPIVFMGVAAVFYITSLFIGRRVSVTK